MTIKYPLDLPTSIASMTLVMIDNVAISRSPYSYSNAQTFAYDDEHWEGTMTLPSLGKVEASKWIAFLASLRGIRGTFQCGIPGHEIPRGKASDGAGNPKVRDNDNEGYSLKIKTNVADVDGYLVAGDFIQVGTRLHVVTKYASTDSTGEATLDIWPGIRGSFADGTLLVVSNAQGIWRLADNERTMEYRANDDYMATFKIIEDH